MMFLTTIRSSVTSHLTRSIRGKRFLKIHVQLDYHPSSQYAGMHLALKQELYLKRGLEVILVKPGKHGGDEPKVVLDKQAEFDISAQSESISIGIVEQNVLIPAICNNVNVRAFASIFQTTPLILLGLPGTALNSVGDLKGLKIGMHIDSTELMKTIVSHSKESTSSVLTVSRADKMDQLLNGSVDAIQVSALI
jgi:ABC-type nitrate/sulfonate/bicarbonate transport system substrate-binding protein